MSEIAQSPEESAALPAPVTEAIPLPPPPPAEEILAAETELPAAPLTVSHMDPEEKEDQGSPVPPEPEDTVGLEADTIENEGDTEHGVQEVDGSEANAPLTLPPTEAAEPAEADPAEDIPPPPPLELPSTPEAVEQADPAEGLTVGTVGEKTTTETDGNDIPDLTATIEDMTLGDAGKASESHLEEDGVDLTEPMNELSPVEPALDTLISPPQESEHDIPSEDLEEPTEDTEVPMAAQETDLGQEEATIDQPWSQEPILLAEEAPSVQQDVSEMTDAPKREKKGKKGKTKTVQIEGQDGDTTLHSIPDTVPETVDDTLPEERRSTRRATGHTREHKSSRTKTKRSYLKTSSSRPDRSEPIPRPQRDLQNAKRRASSGTSTGFTDWAKRAWTSLLPSNTNATSVQSRRRSHAGEESLRRRGTGDGSGGETRRKSRKGAKDATESQKGDTRDTMPTEAAHTFAPSQPDAGDAPTTAATEEQTASPRSPDRTRKSRDMAGKSTRKGRHTSATTGVTATALDDDTLPPMPTRASTAPADTIPAPEGSQTKAKRSHRKDREKRETRSSKSGRRTSRVEGSMATSTNVDVPPPPPPPSPPPTSSALPTEPSIDVGSSTPDGLFDPILSSKRPSRRSTHQSETSRHKRSDRHGRGSKSRRETKATEDTEERSAEVPSSPEVSREADTLDSEGPKSPRVRRSGTDPTSRKTTRTSTSTRGWSMFGPTSTTKSKRKA